MADPAAPSQGPHLTVTEPSGVENDWIFSELQRPAVYERLSLPQAPNRAAFDAHQVLLVEYEGRGINDVSYLIVRHHGEPWGFFLHFGWEFHRDPTRELDIVVGDPGPHSPGLFFEANFLAAHFMFGNRLAKRLRWRVAQNGDRAVRWYGRLGARTLGCIDEPHPRTGALVRKQVYELSPIDVEARGGFGDTLDPLALWRRRITAEPAPSTF